MGHGCLDALNLEPCIANMPDPDDGTATNNSALDQLMADFDSDGDDDNEGDDDEEMQQPTLTGKKSKAPPPGFTTSSFSSSSSPSSSSSTEADRSQAPKKRPPPGFPETEFSSSPSSSSSPEFKVPELPAAKRRKPPPGFNGETGQEDPEDDKPVESTWLNDLLGMASKEADDSKV